MSGGLNNLSPSDFLQLPSGTPEHLQSKETAWRTCNELLLNTKFGREPYILIPLVKDVIVEVKFQSIWLK